VLSRDAWAIALFFLALCPKYFMGLKGVWEGEAGNCDPKFQCPKAEEVLLFWDWCDYMQACFGASVVLL